MKTWSNFSQGDYLVYGDEPVNSVQILFFHVFYVSNIRTFSDDNIGTLYLAIVGRLSVDFEFFLWIVPTVESSFLVAVCSPPFKGLHKKSR